jgi:hypothetical protein
MTSLGGEYTSVCKAPLHCQASGDVDCSSGREIFRGARLAWEANTGVRLGDGFFAEPIAPRLICRIVRR